MSSDAKDISSSWYDFLGWVETNKRGLLWAAVVLVVIVFGVSADRWKTNQTELAANEALLQLRPSSAAAGKSELNPTPADYLKIVQEYPKTAAAERALLLAASTLFTDGQYAEAQSRFEKFLQQYPESALGVTAAYGVAASLEAQGKTDAALTAYQNVQSRYPKSALVDEAKLAMARLYETKNQPELALKTYDEIARPGATGSASTQAMLRKQQLLAAHPELAKTNAPAATVLAGTSVQANATTATNQAPATGTNRSATVVTNRTGTKQ